MASLRGEGVGGGGGGGEKTGGGGGGGGGGGVSSPMLLPQIWHYWTFKNNTEFKRCDVCHAGLSHELKYILS